MNIVVLGNVCLEPDDIQKLEQLGSVRIHPGLFTDPDTISSLISTADILISSLIPLTKEVLDKAPHIKGIILATTGFDDIDLDAAQQAGITVCYTPGYATEAVAEHTLGLMLAATRLSHSASFDLKSGTYDSCTYQGKELYKKTLGTIGYGRIGKRVAEIAQTGFSMNILFTDRNSTRADLETLLQKSDVISLHTPLTSETRHMIGEQEFKLMKDGVIIINTARGGIIDENALLNAIQVEKVFAAGLDVLEHEPLRKDDPLLHQPHVFITPHIAYNTDEALKERSHIVIKSVQNYIAGTPQHAICVPNRSND